ncbi:MAG: hypothetical protein CSA24_01130 [Deltaproteobacteria bacterium]|nr:MAG: hypothetical protein CSA24_01130 [Deltaproteobacteria bacterium]
MLVVAAALAGATLAAGASGQPPEPARSRPAAAPPAPTVTRSSTGDDAAKAAEVFREGLALERKGEYGLACDAYAKAVTLTPDWALARYQYARCLRLLGDLDNQAAKHIAVAETQIRRPPIFIEKGRIAEDHNDREAAIDAYAKAFELAPAEVRAQAGLARLSDDATTDRRALGRMKAYVSRYPRSIAGWRQLARLAEQRRKHKVAEEALLKVIELSPNRRAAVAALGAYGQRTRRRKVVERAHKLLRARAVGRPGKEL